MCERWEPFHVGRMYTVCDKRSSHPAHPTFCPSSMTIYLSHQHPCINSGSKTTHSSPTIIFISLSTIKFS